MQRETEASEKRGERSGRAQVTQRHSRKTWKKNRETRVCIREFVVSWKNFSLKIEGFRKTGGKSIYHLL